MGGGWSTPRPGRSTPGKGTVPIVHEAGWDTGPVWTGAGHLAPKPGFDSRTVQTVASRYTDWTYAGRNYNNNNNNNNNNDLSRTFTRRILESTSHINIMHLAENTVISVQKWISECYKGVAKTLFYEPFGKHKHPVSATHIGKAVALK
jgi:hypothetical protein